MGGGGGSFKKEGDIKQTTIPSVDEYIEEKKLPRKNQEAIKTPYKRIRREDRPT